MTLPPRVRYRLHRLGFALARFGYRYPDERHPIVSALANATEHTTTVASWRAAADPRADRFGPVPAGVLFLAELGSGLRRRYPGASGELHPDVVRRFIELGRSTPGSLRLSEDLARSIEYELDGLE